MTARTLPLLQRVASEVEDAGEHGVLHLARSGHGVLILVEVEGEPAPGLILLRTPGALGMVGAQRARGSGMALAFAPGPNTLPLRSPAGGSAASGLRQAGR